MNLSPKTGGASVVPLMSSLWQLPQCVLYSTRPRSACSRVNTPCCFALRVVSCAMEAPSASASTAAIFMRVITLAYNVEATRVMTRLRATGAAIGVFSALLLMAGSARAQPPDDLRIRYNSGRAVVPIFEGWIRKADGSFELVFGYFNRNYVEEVSLPVGPANYFEPEGPDVGQPAYFYPRLHRFAFRVSVPPDWGSSKEVVWTLTAHGKTEKAVGTLAPIWEIDWVVEIQNAGGGGVDDTSKGPPPRVS